MRARLDIQEFLLKLSFEFIFQSMEPAVVDDYLDKLGRLDLPINFGRPVDAEQWVEVRERYQGHLYRMAESIREVVVERRAARAATGPAAPG